MVEQLVLPLWEVLEDAAIAPDEADLGQLLDTLETALLDLNTNQQLQVAAAGIAQIVQVFHVRSSLIFEELEAATSNDGPVMPADAFDRYVRQTMEVDFEQFIEPLESLPRKVSERRVLFIDDFSSAVGELDRDSLLQALDTQMHQQPELTEKELFDKTLDVAHEEDVSVWTEAIAAYLQQSSCEGVTLAQLQRALNMPLVNVWLGLLHEEQSRYNWETNEEFYHNAAQLWLRK